MLICGFLCHPGLICGNVIVFRIFLDYVPLLYFKVMNLRISSCLGRLKHINFNMGISISSLPQMKDLGLSIQLVF